MKIVIKDDEILAQHSDGQDIDITTMYPSATELKTINDSIEVYKTVIVNEGTPLEREEIVFKTLTELGLTAEDEKVVRIIDGGKISSTTLTALNTASTVEELRTVLSTILTGTP